MLLRARAYLTIQLRSDSMCGCASRGVCDESGASNRTSQTVGGTSTTFTYDNDDRLTSTSGGVVNSYGYNDNGEQTSRTRYGTACLTARRGGSAPRGRG